MNRQDILTKLSDDLTKQIIKNRRSLHNQCNYAAVELCKRAKALGIKLEIQPGLFGQSTEHNWCIDPETGDLYDPTAEQFSSGVNGLVPASKVYLYTALSQEEIGSLIKLAIKAGWRDRFTNGISNVAVGYRIREQKRALLDKVKEFYPTLAYVAYSGPSEIKVAKNGSTYAVLREPQTKFEFTEIEISQWKNGLIVTPEKTRSHVVFENANGSYTIQPIEQRAFVSKSGKHGLLTKRGAKVTVRFNKDGEIYIRERTNADMWKTTKDGLESCQALIEEFKKINSTSVTIV